MATDFQLFGPAHLAILAAVPTAAWALSKAARSSRSRVRTGAGIFLAINELVWYTFRLTNEGLRVPDGLPLHLCDFTLWMTVVSALTLKPRIVEVAYFAGVSGAGMAVITPELWAPMLSYPTIYFFAAHGGVVATMLMLLWSGEVRLERGAPWRALLILNCYAMAVGIFNLAFGTNYMFLCEKPSGTTLLDAMGPWPWYLLAGEVLAAALFWLMWLPWRERGMVRSVPA